MSTFSYIYIMYLSHSQSQAKKAAMIKKITAAQLGQIDSERFVFDWTATEQGCELYQLNLIDDDDTSMNNHY